MYPYAGKVKISSCIISDWDRIVSSPLPSVLSGKKSSISAALDQQQVTSSLIPEFTDSTDHILPVYGISLVCLRVPEEIK